MLSSIFLGGNLNVACAEQIRTGVINCPVASVRSGPGINYSILTTVTSNTHVTILNQQNDWCQIKTGQIEGWVASTLIGTTSQIPLQVKGKIANLRSGPGITYDKLGEVQQGDLLTLLDVYGDWYRIKSSKGIEAYISSSLVETPETAPPTISAVNASLPPTIPKDKVQVLLSNNLLKFDVDPIIENNRTLVPLRAIFEALGATVDWDAANQKIRSTRAATVVELQIGSLHPTVNGQDWPLDVPAKIVKGRTLAPLRFVAEAFGSQVNWDAGSQIISINSSAASKAIAVSAKEMPAPLREAPSSQSKRVDLAPLGERMSVLAEKDGWYQVSRGGRSSWVASWLVSVENNAASNVPPSAETNNPATVNANTQSQTQVEPTNSIRLQTSKDITGLRIMLVSAEKLDPEIKKGSGQITLICKNRQIAGVNTLEEKLGGQQFKTQANNVDKDVQVNINLPVEVEYEILTEENGGRLVVFIPNYITKIDKVPYGSVGERLIISSLYPVEHSEQLLGNKLEIRLKNIKAGSTNNYTCSSSLIKGLQIITAADSPKDLRISIDTDNLGKFSSATTGKNKDLSIFLYNQSALKNGEIIVVLDPGHGGSEPGTNGQYLVERDVNLAVGLKVGDILKKKGIHVEYTRNDDSFLDLEPRAYLANDLNAAVYVSIHHNGFPNPSISGTECFYFAPLENPDLFAQKDQRARLASLIQDELISKLQRNNRGVKNNVNYSVLRNTKMPSIIAEIVYLTNPDEEQLAQQNVFKDLAAQAIANGIITYLNK